jgi:prolyl oligopeptidase
LLQGKKNWKQLYSKQDKVYYMRPKDENIFFLSGFNSPNYKLCKTNINSPNFQSPEVLVKEKNDEVFKSFTITKDGIYYTTTKNGIEAKLYLYKDGKEIPIKLPYVSGDINLQSKGIEFSDIWVSCSGWAKFDSYIRLS